VWRWNDVDHPGDSELVDQRAEAGRPEGFAERHDGLAALRQLVEPALCLRTVLGVQRDIEPVLWLADVGCPVDIHVGTHQCLIADLEPAVHQPGLVFLVTDRHVRRSVCIGHGRGDLSAQHLGVELERLAALALKAEARHDFHGCFPSCSVGACHGLPGDAEPVGHPYAAFAEAVSPSRIVLQCCKYCYLLAASETLLICAITVWPCDNSSAASDLRVMRARMGACALMPKSSRTLASA